MKIILNERLTHYMKEKELSNIVLESVTQSC